MNARKMFEELGFQLRSKYPIMYHKIKPMGGYERIVIKSDGSFLYYEGGNGKKETGIMFFSIEVFEAIQQQLTEIKDKNHYYYKFYHR